MGTAGAAFGVAPHPYVGVPGPGVNDLVVTMPANPGIEVDSNLHHVAGYDVDGSRYDLRAGAALAGISMATAFADHVGTEYAHVSGAAGTVEMWADRSFRWWQMYTSNYLPAESPSHDAAPWHWSR